MLLLLPSRRELSPGIFFIWREMKELTLSIFADESGGQNGTSKYYLLTLVLHDQSLAGRRLPVHGRANRRQIREPR